MPDSHDADLSDQALLARSAAGDRVAFEQVVERHQASIYRFARLIVNRPEDAEDVLQQTFLSAWQGASGFRGDASVRTWLLTITRHAALRARHTRAREAEQVVSLDDLGVLAGWGVPDPETLAVAAERRAQLDAALQSLTSDERVVMTLRDLEGLSGEETASVLGVSVSAMKSRLHRARMTFAARVKAEAHRAPERA